MKCPPADSLVRSFKNALALVQSVLAVLVLSANALARTWADPPESSEPFKELEISSV